MELAEFNICQKAVPNVVKCRIHIWQLLNHIEIINAVKWTFFEV